MQIESAQGSEMAANQISRSINAVNDILKQSVNSSQEMNGKLINMTVEQKVGSERIGAIDLLA